VVESQASTLIHRPPEQVFAFIADGFHRNYRRWSPEVKRLEILSDGPIRTGWTARQVRVDVGRRTEATFRVSRYEAGRRISFEGVTQPFQVDYLFEPIHQHTRVDFRFELSRLDMVLRPFEQLVRMTIQDSTERLVKNLKRVVEAEVAPASR
jgi:hypothetical protein